MHVDTYLSGCQIGNELTFAYNNLDAQYTQKTNDVDVVVDLPKWEYQFIGNNPSTVTDIEVKVFAVEKFSTGLKFALVDTLTFPKAQTLNGTAIDTVVKSSHGAYNGVGIRLIASNLTVLGGADAFNFLLKIKDV